MDKQLVTSDLDLAGFVLNVSKSQLEPLVDDLSSLLISIMVISMCQKRK